MREQIQAQGYHTHVLDVVKKLLDPELELDGAEIEITGPDGGDLVIAVQRKRFDGEN
jgi:hypothetical protein